MYEFQKNMEVFIIDIKNKINQDIYIKINILDLNHQFYLIINFKDLRIKFG